MASENFVDRQRFLKILRESGLGNGGVVPCFENEVTELEQSFGIRLPRAYKEFLLAMGHGAGSLFQGTDFSYSRLRAINASARELLSENCEDSALPRDGFVFYMHQGYEFGFFVCNGEGDPPVSQYAEGYGASVEWLSFTDFFLAQIEYQLRLGE